MTRAELLARRLELLRAYTEASGAEKPPIVRELEWLRHARAGGSPQISSQLNAAATASIPRRDGRLLAAGRD